MRSIWTGSLSFGLVNIPIRLYSATAGTDLKFNYLHAKDHSPINYTKICRAEGKPVPYEEIVKGYEYRKGDYVVLTEADFAKVDRARTKTIDIVDFAQEEEIDPIYFEKPYFLEPDKGAEKPYALLREALKKSGRVGIAKFVLRNREHLAALKPSGPAIVLEQMRFASEVRESAGLKLPESSLANEHEIGMALKLIDQLTQPFIPEDYHDTYTEKLEKIIADKAKGKTIKVEGKQPQPTAVKDLMAMLKASLEEERSKQQS